MSDFSLRARAQSFVDAGRGLVRLLADQPNARIHLLASLAAIALGAWLGLSAGEWCWIALAIALVWVAEGLNSALEALADAVHPERDPRVGRAKDVAAGAVLLAAIASVVIGALVFGPRLAALLEGSP
jgi:diacylglycerol kinase (ATP)